jgi:hypothetical protein
MRARLAAHEGLAEALPLAEQAVAWTQKRPADLTRRARAHLVLAEVHRSVGRDAEAQSSLADAIALFELKGNLAEAAAAARRFAGTDARRRPEEVASSARSEPVG